MRSSDYGLLKLKDGAIGEQFAVLVRLDKIWTRADLPPQSEHSARAFLEAQRCSLERIENLLSLARQKYAA